MQKKFGGIILDKKIFDEYGNIYRKILEKIYPANGSTGFAERNLSVNFSKAYEKIFPSALSWFEFQFGKKKHIDAVIVNEESQEIFVIESKRYSVQSKITAVGHDIDRIKTFLDELKKENDRRIDLSKIKKFYGVILADVWTEVDFKRKILQSYQEENFLTEFKEFLKFESKISNPHYNVQDIENIENYFLVSMWFEFKLC